MKTTYGQVRQEFDAAVQREASSAPSISRSGGQQYTTAAMLRMEREIIARMQEGNQRGYNDPMLVSPQIRDCDRGPAPGAECLAASGGR